ncbi:MAG: hypothetical protein C4K58_05770 [Flavobacteriaceae bacterium]|nr:MAG: hypothetical protein C4K58_05770 [Flavobacteriaceae bacterium]
MRSKPTKRKNLKNPITLFLFILASSVFAQKVTIKVPNDISYAKAPNDNKPMAGVAIRDITASWKMSMAGHAVFSGLGMGIRDRIKVRAIYLQDANNKALALVQLDLVGGDLLLHHRVSEMVQKATGLKPEQITLLGTHTHKSFGNIWDNDLMNMNGKQNVAGFDEKLNLFVCNKIAEAIIESYNNRKIAKIATGSIEIYGHSWNRSIESYAANYPDKKINTKDKNERYKSINPNFNMIRIDALDKDGKYKPLATLSNFGAHGTAVSEIGDLYSGDWFGVTQRYLDHKINANYNASWESINAISAGIEGDTEPNMPYKKTGDIWGTKQLDYDAVDKVGEGIGKKALELFYQLESKLKSDYNLSWKAKEVDLLEERTINNVKLGKPIMGLASAGGPYSNSGVPIFKGPRNPLTRRWIFNTPLQGRKIPIGWTFGLFQKLVLGPIAPHKVMFQIYQIDDTYLIPLPWEVTVFSGIQIQEALQPLLNVNEINKIQVLSVANGVLTYASSPKEYNVQDYNGGQNWFGINTVPYIVEQLKDLTTFKENTAKLLDKWEFNISKQISDFKLDTTNVNTNFKRDAVKQPIYFEGETTKNIIYQSAFQFEWKDLAFDKINWNEPLIEVQESNDGESWKTVVDDDQPITDQGYKLYIRIYDNIETNGKNGMTYRADWINPKLEKGKKYRFVVKSRYDIPEFYSDPFGI